MNDKEIDDAIAQLDNNAKIILRTGLLIVLGSVEEFKKHLLEIIKKLN